MYYLNKKTTIYHIYIRGYNLTKKLDKKQTKSSLVFLRAPKHFNIGKRKVLSFKNYNSYAYNTHFILPLNVILNNSCKMFNLLQEIHKFHLLYKIASIKISLKLKIKFL